MKLAARDVHGFITKPMDGVPGILIYGQDPMRVALRRKEIIDKIGGPNAEDEMRLTRILGSELRKEPSTALDAIKSVGFFPGTRIVHIEDANETAAAGVINALEDWEPGDAVLVITAGALKPTSKVRKAFETHSSAASLAIYNDPPSRAEVDALLQKANLSEVDRDGRVVLDVMAREMDPGDFQQFIEKLSLYTLQMDGPITGEHIAKCAPLSTEAGVDDVLHCVAEARTDTLIPLMQRLESQGVTPTALCINALRHFKSLHSAASDPGGAGQGIAKLRPPVFGPRRDRMLRQAQNWGRSKLEQAISILLETDLKLRSANQTAPQIAVVERSFIRLSMLGRV